MTDFATVDPNSAVGSNAPGLPPIDLAQVPAPPPRRPGTSLTVGPGMQLVPVDHDPFADATPQLVPVDHDPFASVSTAEDVARVIPGHLARGALGLAGMPGYAMSAADTAGDWLNKKYEEAGFNVKPSRVPRVAPTGEELIDKAEGVMFPPTRNLSDLITGQQPPHGKFYEATTPVGKVVGNAAEFVPGALMPGGGAKTAAGFVGGMVKNAFRYGVLPGAASEVAGQATEGKPIEPWARLATALGVGGVGAIASQPRTAERFIKSQMPSYVTDRHVTLADGLIRQAAGRGITLTWPEALSQVTGKPVLNDMQRVMEGAKQTRSTMQEALGQRGEQIARAGQAEAGNIAPATTAPSTIGPAVGAAAESGIGDVRKAINTASEKFYDAAKTHTLSAAEMDQVRQIPGYGLAAKAVRADPQLNREVAHLPENSVGFLNEVKKYFDQAAQNAASPVQQGRSVQRAAGLGRDAEAVRDAAINSEAAAGTADYAQALHIQETNRSRYLEPLLQGPLGKLADKDITTKKAIAELFPAEPLAGSQHEITTAVAALAARNPGAARLLVRAHVEAKLNEAFNAAGRSAENAGTAGASFAHDLTGSPIIDAQRGQNFRAAIKALPNGKQIWPGIERFLEVTRATGWRQPIGSKTSFNEAELHAMATGKSVANIAKTAASPGEWWHVAHEMWGKWQTGNNLAALAKIITDPRSEGVFRKIVTMPKGIQATHDMAARLTFAVGVGTRSQFNKPDNKPQ